MPGAESRGNASFWWSMDQGPIHITSFSSESDYTPGSVQYAWLEADMAAARANPNVKWLLFSGHRPLYSSDTDEWSAHQPGCPLLVALEPLLNKYAVDMVLTGHEHMVREPKQMRCNHVRSGQHSRLINAAVVLWLAVFSSSSMRGPGPLLTVP